MSRRNRHLPLPGGLRARQEAATAARESARRCNSAVWTGKDSTKLVPDFYCALPAGHGGEHQGTP